MKKALLTLFVTLNFGVCLIGANHVNLTPSSINKNTEHHNLSRTPIRIPDVFIEDYTLTFDSSCIGCNVTLLQDDIVIFTAIVEENDDMEGEVVLPEFLEGQYEIRLEIGSIIFVGEIDL